MIKEEKGRDEEEPEDRKGRDDDEHPYLPQRGERGWMSRAERAIG
jgi:hypothetical protein